MSIVALILVLVFVGVALWVINQFVPPPARQVFMAIVLLVFLVWLAQALGLLTGTIRIR